MILIDAIKNRVAHAVAERLNPRVADRLHSLEAEVRRLTVDNARLQQEVSMMQALRAAAVRPGGS